MKAAKGADAAETNLREADKKRLIYQGLVAKLAGRMDGSTKFGLGGNRVSKVKWLIEGGNDATKAAEEATSPVTNCPRNVEISYAVTATETRVGAAVKDAVETVATAALSIRIQMRLLLGRDVLRRRLPNARLTTRPLQRQKQRRNAVERSLLRKNR